jgi:hypothetical protein
MQHLDRNITALKAQYEDAMAQVKERIAESRGQ